MIDDNVNAGISASTTATDVVIDLPEPLPESTGVSVLSALDSTLGTVDSSVEISSPDDGKNKANDNSVKSDSASAQASVSSADESWAFGNTFATNPVDGTVYMVGPDLPPSAYKPMNGTGLPADPEGEWAFGTRWGVNFDGTVYMMGPKLTPYVYKPMNGGIAAPTPPPASGTPQPPPAAGPAPTSPQPAPQQPNSGPPTTTYTVQPGDTFWGIACQQLGAGVSDAQIQYQTMALMQVNPGVDPLQLQIGQTLNLVEPENAGVVSWETEARYRESDSQYRTNLAYRTA